MNDQCQIKIELSIVSRQMLDENLLTQIVGEKATIFEQKGSISKKGKIRDISAWIYGTNYIQSLEVEQLLFTFLRNLTM